MWIFYVIAFLPVLVGVFLWMFDKKIIFLEWLICAAISFALAGIMHATVYYVMTNDYETWSGYVIQSTHYPEWVEEYEEAHYTHDSKGNITGVYYTTEYRTHSEYWDADTSLGTAYDISESKYLELKKNFGSMKIVQGSRPGYYKGDKNDYVLVDVNKYIEPINETRSFRNMFKASQSVMTYVKVPKDVKVFDYPKSKSVFVSNRLLGNPGIDIKQWDQMNAELGSSKKVNIILVKFENKESVYAQYQEAKWLGGKKNDLVICFSSNKDKLNWCICFGWTEKESVKRNIESIVLSNPMDNKIIPLIKQEIVTNYQIKDWKKFDYLSLYPPLWACIVFGIFMMIFQIGYWYWAITEDLGERKKDDYDFDRY